MMASRIPHGVSEAQLGQGPTCNEETKYMAVMSDEKDIWEPVTKAKFNFKNFCTALQFYSVKLGLCNLEFPYTFLESVDIIQYCSAFGCSGITLSEVKRHRVRTITGERSFSGFAVSPPTQHGEIFHNVEWTDLVSQVQGWVDSEN